MQDLGEQADNLRTRGKTNTFEISYEGATLLPETIRIRLDTKGQLDVDTNWNSRKIESSWISAFVVCPTSPKTALKFSFLISLK
ncbi:hypothetical protein RUM43_007783 [Polyplax serrata]|uniref:Uncharacterized protein n=1 Tax=Polyplax serrata TaxID=468196 RepID=A0AAN8S5R3_POLSC